MRVKLYNHKGESVKEVDLNNRVFGLEINPNLIYTVYQGILSNRRKPIAHAKDRSEVSGGGRKPWKQKGTGRARHGSIRSPIWKGGGVTFGPNKDRNYTVKINQKAKEKALKMILSSKVQSEGLKLIEDFKGDINKTKDFEKILKSIFKKEKIQSAVLLDNDRNSIRYGRNLPYLTISAVNNIDLVDLINKKYLIVTESALDALTNKFTAKK